MNNQNAIHLITKHHAAAKCLEYATNTKDATCKAIAMEQYEMLMDDIRELDIPEEEEVQYLQPSNFDILDEAFAIANMVSISVYDQIPYSHA